MNGAPTDTFYRFTDSTRAYISVFRYAVPAHVRVGPDSVAWLEREGAKFAAIQPIFVQRGIIQSYEVRLAKVATVQLGGVPVAEHVSAIQTQMRTGVFNELEYLYVVGGKFLKVRASVRETGQTSTDVPHFARELARQVMQASRQ